MQNQAQRQIDNCFREYVALRTARLRRNADFKSPTVGPVFTNGKHRPNSIPVRCCGSNRGPLAVYRPAWNGSPEARRSDRGIEANKRYSKRQNSTPIKPVTKSEVRSYLRHLEHNKKV